MSSIWSHNRIAAPIGEPLTLAEAKNFLRLDDYGSPPGHPDDALVTRLIVNAREYVERATGRALRRQTWQLRCDRFPLACEPIQLLRLPLIDIVSILYDTGDADAMFQAFELVSDDWSALIYPTSGWPGARRRPNSVRVTYRAGYESGSPLTASVPERLAHAMRAHIDFCYRARDEGVDMEELDRLMTISLGDYISWTV